LDKGTLELFAVQLGETGRVEPASRRYGKKAIKRITISRREKKNFKNAYDTFYRLSKEGKSISHGMLWITDNYSWLQDEIEKSMKEVSLLTWRLPVVTEGDMRGLPSIYAASMAFIYKTRGNCSNDDFITFFSAYSQPSRLTLKELWAIEAMIRLVLLRQIITVAVRLSQMAQGNAGGLRSELDDERFALETGCACSVRSAVILLKSLGDIDWETLFCEANPIHEILSGERSGVYLASDEKTKKYWWELISKAAYDNGISERGYAGKLVTKANDAYENGEGEAKGSVGFYIKERNSLGKAAFTASFFALYAFIIVLTAVLLYVKGADVWEYMAVFTTVSVLAITVSLKWAQWICVRLTGGEKRVLPCLDARGTEKKPLDTIITVATLITSCEYAEKMIRRLEEHYLTNNDEFLSYALLCDLKESDKELEDADSEILAVLEKGVQYLNRKYSSAAPRFYVFVRKRVYDPKTKLYTAYERKRGAVLGFTQKLCGKNTGEFRSIFPQKEGEGITATYCIVLDADTRIRPRGAKEFVFSAAHPLNAPVIDEKTGRVERGYTVITAPIGVNAFSASKTRLARILSGGGGEGVYAASPFDIWWDIFGEGSFCGKGIINCKAFSQLMENRFEDGVILSHDLIEGGYCSTGVIRSVDLTDDFPCTWLSYRKREHRWIRGDWQLIGFLARHVKRKGAKRVRNTLGVVTKVKISLNLVRSLIYLKLLKGLILGIPYPFLAQWVFVWFLLKNVLPVTVSVLKNAFLAVFGRKISIVKKEDVFLPLVHFMLIGDTATYSFNAICKAVTRLFTGKRLLEWETAQQAEDKGRAHSLYRVMFVSVITATLMVVVPFIWGKGLISLLAGIAFLFAPLLAERISRADNEITPGEKEKALLLSWCRDAWRFFEEVCNEDTSWLPPDNIQVYPVCPPCTKTSPTNIGMYFTSLVTAHSLGFIDTEGFADRAEKALESLEKMEKYKGHTYNWYDIRTLKPIHPFFISTADNGNLAVSLLVLSQKAVDMITENGGCHRDRLLKINAVSRKLATDMDFSILYSAKKKLFAIGYSVQDKSLTDGVYDLIASEARLASIFAIAYNQIEYRHWTRLTRKLTLTKKGVVLMSWSGTMFEYLMPELFFRSVNGSLMSRTHKNMLKLQIKYGTENTGSVWGVSESGYYAFDRDKRYQYRAFGIPYTAIDKAQSGRYVVSPYSSALALMVDAKSAIQNMAVLKNEIAHKRLYGKYKYFLEEAVDYFNGENSPSVVEMYMAHHTGMAVTAMGNVLCDKNASSLFMSCPEISALAPFITEPFEGEACINRRKDVADIPDRGKGEDICNIDGVLQTRYCALLTNGGLKGMYTSDGGGYLMLGDELATAYSGVYPRETQGSFVYIRNEKDKSYFSVSPAPCYNNRCAYRVEIRAGEVEYSASSQGVCVKERICISPEDNVEIREVTLKGSPHSDKDYSVTGYTVPCLSRYGDWCAHRVFNEIFMSVEYCREKSLFIVKKKAKKEKDTPRYLMYMLVSDDNGEVSYSADRESFIGRGRDASCPGGMEDGLADTSKTVIYPCVAIRKRVDISKGDRTLYFVTGMFYSLNELYNAVQIYKSTQACRDTFHVSALRERITRDCLGINAMGVKCSRMIASRVFFPVNRAFYKGNIDAFYKLGLSGNTPVMLCEITGAMGYRYFLKTVLEVFAYLRSSGLPIELIIAVASVNDYREELFKSVTERAERFKGIGSITVVNGRDISNNDMRFIRCAAKVTLSDGAGTLYERLKTVYGEWDRKIRLPNSTELIQKAVLFPVTKQYLYKTKYGYFTNDGGEYHITSSDGTQPPLAWSNMLVDGKNFGAVITDRAGGFTWYGTAQNRLTRWYNDPVEDPPTETVYIKNDITDDVFTPQNIGYTPKGCIVKMKDNSVETVSANEQYTASLNVYTNENIKFTEVTVCNKGKKGLSLTLYYYADIFLPSNNHTMFPVDMFARGDIGTPALEIMGTYGNTSVVMSCDKGITGWLCKKEEFFGRGGIRDVPLAVVNSSYYTESHIQVADCGVIATRVNVPGEGSISVRFALTALEMGNKRDEYKAFRSFAQDIRRNSETGEINEASVKIETPCQELDIFFNNKLMKQIYGIRYMARTSYYQCSGAYGFRDQLQDMLAIMYKDSDVARQHILLCSARQFEEGDVLHWFNEDYKLKGLSLSQRLPLSGVRTRISDDKLFLPFVATRYALFTGDKAIFDEVTPFLRALPLGENEGDRFITSFEYGEGSSLYNHCIRAFENAYATGAHGLLLMGSGDWNDAMDSIGDDGMGESVWLSMFYVYTAKCFSRLFGDRKEVEKILLNAEGLITAIDKNAWDGNWFIRAFYGDKTPVGSHICEECRIDLLAQAWAVIADIGGKDKKRQGMENAWRYLFDEKNRVLKLFTPPYENVRRHPGYIKGYIPGTRENGGQYTHGAIWYAIACLMSGEADKGWEILKACNPVERTRTAQGVERYKTEPYWLAADIYSAPGCEGRGGWSGYTGSASWYFIAIVEYLMGIKIEDGKMIIAPSLPQEWNGYSVCIKYACAKYHVTVKKSTGTSLYVDGKEHSQNDLQPIPLYKDGEHIIEYFFRDSHYDA